MLDPKNMVNLTAGIVADPEIINDKIAKFRVAIDYAGSEKGAQSTSGYFDVTYYLKDGNDFANKNASFVHGQITQGKMKKGSQVSIIGRLVQERWQQDNSNRSKVVVIAEHMAYAANSAPKSSDSSSGGSAKATNASVPEEF
jgi:single-stranded DNA-binding protein